MRMTLAPAAAILMGTAALAFAGCGGDGGSDSAADGKAIEAAVTKALTTTDPQVKCVEVVTDGFVKNVYGTLDQCKKAEAPDPDDDPKPTGASTSNLKVDGDAATAVVTVEGGSANGSSGEISFEKVSGDWKVSDLSIGFLRSQLAAAITAAPVSEAGNEPLDDAKGRTCIVKAFDALPDAQFKAIAFKAIADQDPDPTFVKIFNDCTSAGGRHDAPAPTDSTSSSSDDSGEQSLLRRQFESGIRDAAKKDGATDAEIDCVLKELRTSISEDDIVEEVGRAGKGASPELAQTTAAAIQKCG